MEIGKSSEDYLETMLMMLKKHGFIRSIDGGGAFGRHQAQRQLCQASACGKRLYSMDKTGLITLEPTGMAIAQEMLGAPPDPHQFFRKPGGRSRKRLRATPAKIEHDLSPQTFAAICRHAREHQG